MAKNKLAEGVLGSKMVKYFELYEDKVPVDAEYLQQPTGDYSQRQYRLTFEDGSVSDWLFTFEHGRTLVIVSAEMFNEVI